MKNLLGGVFAGVLALTGSAFAQEAPKDPETFKIGAILAMSGAASQYGKVMSEGINLAVDEINAAGGIDGIKLEVIIEDHKSGVAKEGVAALNRLTTLNDTQIVLTSFSAPTLAIAPIADDNKILLLNGGGVSTALVGASKYLFHNRSLASDLGKAAVTRATELGLTQMSELVWKNDAGESIRDEVGPYWAGLGGKLGASESIDAGAANIDTQIAKIRASKPEFVGLWLFSPETGLAIKRLREFGFDKPIIGIEYTADILTAAGEAAEGYEYTSDFFSPSGEFPWSKNFADAYEARYGSAPDFYAANYYEDVYVAVEAIKRARAKGGDYYHGDKLAEAIRENPEFESVYGGVMTYQDNGVAKKNVALFRVEDGAPKFQRYIEPK